MAAVLAVALGVALLSSGGCAGKNKNQSLAGASRGSDGGGGMSIPFTPFKIPGSGQSSGPGTPLNMDEVRSQVMSLADSYIQTVVQSLEQLVTTTKDPHKLAWARQQRLATVTVSMTNATGPNALVGLLDMVVFATLKREAIEKHWIPSLLGEEGQPVAAAHRRGEEEAWAAAARVLTRSQREQLEGLINQWRREHPEQYYVGYTRFSDFDAYRNLSPQSPEARAPGNLFSLFYVDPLAGLDPVAKELRSYRALTERIAYIASRLPIMAAYQIDLAVTGAIENPQVRTVVASTERFANATDRFVQVVADYPKALSTERDAAVKQLAEATAREREAIIKQIEAQDGRIRAILGDVTKLIERVEGAGTSLSASTTQTLAAAEGTTQRTMKHAFWYALILVVVILAGVPGSLIAYRLMRRRIELPVTRIPQH